MVFFAGICTCRMKAFFAVIVTNLSVALQYFLHSRHRNLGPGFISMSPVRMMRVSRLVPLEGLKFCRPSELLRLPSFTQGLRSFKNSNGTNLLILIVLAGDIEMNPGPRFQCRLCKKIL